MALYDFRNACKALNNLLVHTATLQIQSHIGASGIAQSLRIHIETTTRNDPVLDEMLYSLMNRSA